VGKVNRVGIRIKGYILGSQAWFIGPFWIFKPNSFRIFQIIQKVLRIFQDDLGLTGPLGIRIWGLEVPKRVSKGSR